MVLDWGFLFFRCFASCAFAGSRIGNKHTGIFRFVSQMFHGGEENLPELASGSAFWCNLTQG